MFNIKFSSLNFDKMQKLYKIVTLMLIVTLLFTSNISQAQNCCIECQTDVKLVSDKQVLLEKIDIKEGTTLTNFSTNVYVSYRSGNANKFWANVAIATAGVAISTQLNSSPITAGDSKSQSAISPIVPLSISVATLPGIWKNRPRGVPQAGLWIQHRNLKGELLENWEQSISEEAKNSAELLTIAVDKPLSEGTLEVYLQNGSKNEVYFWGYETAKKINEKKALSPKTPTIANNGSCPNGYLPNGNGRCCSPFTGECVNEDDGYLDNATTKAEVRKRIVGSTGSTSTCPNGYLPNGQGMCCNPFNGECVATVRTQSRQSSSGCDIVETCNNFYTRVCFQGSCSDWQLQSSDCSYETVCPSDGGGGGTGGGGGSGGGGGGGGNGGGGGTGVSSVDAATTNMPDPIWIYDGNGPVSGPFGPTSMSNDGGKIVFYFGGFPQMGEIINTNLADVTVVYTKPLSNVDGIWIWMPKDISPTIRDKYQIAAELCQNTYDGWAAVAQTDADIAAASFQAFILSVGGTAAGTSGLVAWVEANYGASLGTQIGIAVAGYSTLENLGIVDPIKYVTDIVKNATYQKGLRIAQSKFVDCMVQRLSN